jgi:hypothetical protein
MTDNPYVDAQMSLFTAVYCGEIHAISEVNNDDKAEELTYEILKMFGNEFQDVHHVDTALDHILDLSLEAEVCRWRGLMKCMKGINEQIRQLENCLFSLGVDQRSCRQRLQNAKAVHRVLEEMGRDQHIHLLMPWSAERGHST